MTSMILMGGLVGVAAPWEVGEAAAIEPEGALEEVTAAAVLETEPEIGEPAEGATVTVAVAVRVMEGETASEDVIAAVAGADVSMVTLREGCELAKESGAEVELLPVPSTPPSTPAAAKRAPASCVVSQVIVVPGAFTSGSAETEMMRMSQCEPDIVKNIERTKTLELTNAARLDDPFLPNTLAETTLDASILAVCAAIRRAQGGKLGIELLGIQPVLLLEIRSLTRCKWHSAGTRKEDREGGAREERESEESEDDANGGRHDWS